MKNTDGALGEFGAHHDMGEVDMFGLDEFGQPAGGDSMWGSVIGGGVSTGTSIIARAMSKETSAVHKYSELAGLLAGSAAGGIMMAFPGTRRMGWAAIATSLVTNGLRQIERSLFSSHSQAAVDKGIVPPTPEAVKSGWGQWGSVVIDPTAVIQPGQGGFGIHTIEPGYVVPANLPSMMNNGFGAAAIEPAYPVQGSISNSHGFGMAPELVGPPTLAGAGDYGMSDNPAVTQTKLLGGPSLSAMGAHFGATLFGGNS